MAAYCHELWVWLSRPIHETAGTPELQALRRPLINRKFPGFKSLVSGRKLPNRGEVTRSWGSARPWNRWKNAKNDMDVYRKYRKPGQTYPPQKKLKWQSSWHNDASKTTFLLEWSMLHGDYVKVLECNWSPAMLNVSSPHCCLAEGCTWEAKLVLPGWLSHCCDHLGPAKTLHTTVDNYKED